MPEIISDDKTKKKPQQLFCQGKEYPLSILELDQSGAAVSLKDGSIIVRIDKRIPLVKRNIEIRNVLKEWYKEKAKTIIKERLAFFAHEMGLQYNNVRIKEQKTRWGSCSQKGNLNFNWRLVMMPEAILDYVIVHELCHLVQMNHSARFWQLVRNQVPDFKEKRLWLKNNGSGYII